MMTRSQNAQSEGYTKWLLKLKESHTFEYYRRNNEKRGTIEFKANREHLAFLKFCWDENIISAMGEYTEATDEDELDDFPGTLDFAYVPPNAVRWAWYFMDDRFTDPLHVARWRPQTQPELMTFNLVEWASQFWVENTLDFLSLLRTRQEGRSMNLLSMVFKREIMVYVIITDLKSKGNFYYDKSAPNELLSKALYWHNKTSGELFFSNRLLNHIMDEYQIFARDEKNAIIDQLEMIAHIIAEPRDVYTLYQWDVKNYSLHYYNGNGKTYSMDGDKIKTITNGETMIFRDVPNYEPFKLINEVQAFNKLKKYKAYGVYSKPPGFLPLPDSLKSPLFNLTALRCNFSETSVFSREQQQILYYIILHALPFVTLMESIPIVSAHGDPGAGKTFSIVQLAKFILGTNYKPEPLPENRGDFWTILADNRLLVFDNVEFLPKWVPDALASVATGVRVTKRALFTNWDVTNIDPRLFIFMTSVKAPYRQAAVVERLIPFSFSKFDRNVEKESSLPVLMEPYSEYRNELTSLYLHNLNKIVALIKKKGGLRGKTTHRMGDFAILASIINESLGLSSSEFFNTTMDDLVKQRSAFALFDEPWFNALSKVFKDNPGKGFSVKDLTAKINEITIEEGQDYIASTIGKYLKTYHHDLNTVFNIERRNHGGKSMVYSGKRTKTTNQKEQGKLDGFLDDIEDYIPEKPESQKSKFTRVLDYINTNLTNPIIEASFMANMKTALKLDESYLHSFIKKLLVDGTLYKPSSNMIAKA